VIDRVDGCPTEREDRDQHDDDDGCPDPDNDSDGLYDKIDECPLEAEDSDGVADDDGCPDPDSDGDGLDDVADRCPTEAGVVDNGGCPDTDRDGDGVVDRLDNCPDETGSAARQGCKDKQLVAISGGKLELLDIVYFDWNKASIQKRSHKLLRNVATVLAAHPEVTRVAVEGHTDDQGDDAYNKDLSQRRADAVRTFLVGAGVDEGRLVAIGYGEERPLVANDSSKNRAKNRRVAFTLSGVAADVAAP
jgi:outer membrane protein OmpA-like peptidoglycan-associated protein